MTMSRPKKIIVIMLKIGLAALAFWYLLTSGRLPKENFIGLFAIKNIPFVIASILFFFVNQSLTTTRLLLLLRTVHISIPFTQAYQLTLMGFFFQIIMPGRAGGDIIKGYYLFKTEENNRGRSSGILVLDRLMGLTAAVFLSGLFVVLLLLDADAAVMKHRHMLYGAMAVIAASALFLAGLFFFGTHDRVRGFLKSVFSRLMQKSFFYHLFEGMGRSLKDRNVLLKAFLISVAIQLITIISLLVLGYMLSAVFSRVMILAGISSLVLLSSAVPVTMGNIGWTELLGSIGWSVAGSAIGGVVFLYWRIIGLLCSLPGVFFYLSLSRGNRRLIPRQPEKP